jgi:hypothetical protein
MEDLAARLDRELPLAVGILSILWDFAATFTPRGDIGKYSNEILSRKLGWRGDPGTLIDALIASGWLDRDEGHRLLIHDWPTHCEDSVHAKLARDHLYFANGQAPRLAKLDAKEKTAAVNSMRQPAAASGSRNPPTAAHPSVALPGVLGYVIYPPPEPGKESPPHQPEQRNRRGSRKFANEFFEQVENAGPASYIDPEGGLSDPEGFSNIRRAPGVGLVRLPRQCFERSWLNPEGQLFEHRVMLAAPCARSTMQVPGSVLPWSTCTHPKTATRKSHHRSWPI